MIELRWLEKPKEQPIYDAGENVRVLQYRYRHPHGTIPQGFHSVQEWSEWQDVPTVTEADGTFTARVDVTSRNIG